MKFKLNKEIELTDEEVQEIVKQNSKPKGVEIKRWDNSEVIFTSTKQRMKEAVEEAVSKGVSLAYANLRFADLSHTYLSYADLSHAYLSYTDLSNTDLRFANLSNAYLSHADLHNTDLYNTNLSHADLYNAYLYGKEGTQKLTKDQVPDFLKALGFIIE